MGRVPFYGMGLVLNGLKIQQPVWLEEEGPGIFLAGSWSRSMSIFSARPLAAYAHRWALGKEPRFG